MSLVQTWEYGEAKQQTTSWQVERGFLQKGKERVGMAQSLVRPLPFGLGGLAWINRAPIGFGKLNNLAQDTSRYLSALVYYYTKERGYYLRIAPPLEVGEINTVDIEKAGLKVGNDLGWASAKLNLSPSLNDIRLQLNRKWRGHLNRAKRSGMIIRSGYEAEKFNLFLSAHERAIKDKDFKTTVTPQFLSAMQDLLPPQRKMLVINAHMGTQHVGSILLAYYGESAEYLAGNTSSIGRKCGAGQLLLWHGIKLLKENGIINLDVSGQDPVKTPQGILTFKQGLNAKPYRLVNTVFSEDSRLANRLIGWRVNQALKLELS